MSKIAKTYIVARNSKTGHFVSAREAARHPKNVTIERVEKDSKRIPKELRSVVIRQDKKR